MRGCGSNIELVFLWKISSCKSVLCPVPWFLTFLGGRLTIYTQNNNSSHSGLSQKEPLRHLCHPQWKDSAQRRMWSRVSEHCPLGNRFYPRHEYLQCLSTNREATWNWAKEVNLHQKTGLNIFREKSNQERVFAHIPVSCTVCLLQFHLKGKLSKITKEGNNLRHIDCSALTQ